MYIPNEQLGQSGCSLVHGDLERIEVELEENARCAAVVVKHASVVGYAVLVRVERLGARRDVCRGYDMEEVLVRDEG